MMSPAPAQDVRLVSQTVDDSRTFSASFLSDVWLEWVQPRLHYMRCYMSTLTATIAAIDHTVKAAHKVVMANGKTAFVAVCSVMSSENRILGQFATISFSMEEHLRPSTSDICIFQQPWYVTIHPCSLPQELVWTLCGGLTRFLNSSTNCRPSGNPHGLLAAAATICVCGQHPHHGGNHLHSVAGNGACA